jgi:hypothetical protein
VNQLELYDRAVPPHPQRRCDEDVEDATKWHLAEPSRLARTRSSQPCCTLVTVRVISSSCRCSRRASGRLHAAELEAAAKAEHVARVLGFPVGTLSALVEDWPSLREDHELLAAIRMLIRRDASDGDVRYSHSRAKFSDGRTARLRLRWSWRAVTEPAPRRSRRSGAGGL